MELKDYWKIIRNHWMGVLAFIAVGATLAFGWSLTQPDVYAASASGFVSAGTSGDAGLESLGDSLAKSKAKSYVVLATDSDTADLVAKELGNTETGGALAGRISVEQPADTVSLKITATGPTPEDAQALANAWVKGLAQRVQQIENRSNTDDKSVTSTMSIVPSSSAQLPGAPISPKPMRNALLGGILGGLLGFAYAIVRNQLDRRIRTPDQVDKLGVHVVASLPEVSKASRDLGLITIGNEQHSNPQVSEGFRKLRTNISYLDVDNPPRVIVVTSPNQGDGKSSVATNLAAVIAVGGTKVTLLDGDLRRPRVAKALGLADDIGLTDVLAGRVELADALQQSKAANLQILAAGNRPPNPSELLGSQAMRKLLQDLAADGMVIVDAPPLLPVTDAAVLTRAADGALVVVSAGTTLDTHLAAALENLRAVQGRVLGVVLNRVSKRRSTSDYYGQQYKYTYDERKPSKATKSSSRSTGKRRAHV